MRYALVIPDGAADRPFDALGGRTPLEAADLPHFRRVAREGCLGLANNVPEGMSPGSDVACLSLMGYDPRAVLTGRAALEAASRGVVVPDGDAVFRANLVTVEDGVMKDYSAGHIDDDSARELVVGLDAALGIDGVRLYPGVGYRHLCVIEAMAGRIPSRKPPHDIMDLPTGDYDPVGEFASWLLEIERASEAYFRDAPANRRRVAEGHAPVSRLWLWGGATPMTLEPFARKFGVEGALVSAVDLMRGIAALAGLPLLAVPGITGYYDTNYAGKAEAALRSLAEKPFVCVHVEATDEAGHNGDAPAKVAALEAIDRHILAPLLAEAERTGDLRILVSPDHPTPLALRTHSSDPVPFAFWGPGVASNGAEAFTEAEAARVAGGSVRDGRTLMPSLLGNV